ncbi:dithiol-disulfide isomerase [Lactococcus termiticola]|uniref:Dithiol-disulfide isomerase n=1 Tax=Lactococcus termiticola TaxID=2169526 RepID=A0A2R5HIC9_9LACT|nr:dithiol-disulfide isomerase [Lactococcus termiticola]GBG96058.1 dithiol-disulfide isomerase [Lactococcus termiticola]
MYEIQYYFTPVLDSFEPFDSNYDWHLKPIVNLATAKKLRDRQGLTKNIAMLNASYDRLQRISEDFVSLSLYGRKTSRAFILSLQDRLREPGSFLEYNASMRAEILAELGIEIRDFKEYRQFAKKKLKQELYDYQDQHFASLPASLILTADEGLQLEKCRHEQLQSYLLDKISA